MTLTPPTENVLARVLAELQRGSLRQHLSSSDPLLAVPSLERVIERGEAHLFLSERQSGPSLRESFVTGLVCLAIGLVMAKIALGLLIAFMFLPPIVALVHVMTSWHRGVGVVAFPHYFLVVRTNQKRRGRTIRWDALTGPGQIIAILERSATLRPEERTPSPLIRELVVFNEGRMSVLLSGRMSEDEGIEALHKLRGFFERFTRSTSPKVEIDFRQAQTQGPAAAPAGKGTLR